MSKLTAKQKRFANEYLIDLNAAQAAIRTGYSIKTAKSQGQRLLTNADLKKYIEKHLDKDAESNKILIAKVIQELQKIGFSDINDYMTWDEETGKIIPSKDIDTTALSQVVISEKHLAVKKESEIIDRQVKFKMHDKIKALDILSKYLKLYSDNVNVNFPDKIVVTITE